MRVFAKRVFVRCDPRTSRMYSWRSRDETSRLPRFVFVDPAFGAQLRRRAQSIDASLAHAPRGDRSGRLATGARDAGREVVALDAGGLEPARADEELAVHRRAV